MSTSHHKASLAQHSAADRRSAGAQAARMTKAAVRESRLVAQSRHVLNEMERAEDVISKSLGRQDKKVATDVERLLGKAEHYHKKALGAETAEARHAWKAASAAQATAWKAAWKARHTNHHQFYLKEHFSREKENSI